MAIFKYKNPTTNEWEAIIGGGTANGIPITSNPSDDTTVWIDTSEDGEVTPSMRVITGTYVGTDSTSKTLTFDEAPVMVMIIGSGSYQYSYNSTTHTYYYKDFAVLHGGGGLYYGKENDNYTELSPISVISFNTTVTFTGKDGGYIDHGASLNSQTGTTDAGAVMNNSHCIYRYIAFFA